MLVTIRHGKTQFNNEDLFSGQGDEARLLPESLELAYQRGKELKKYNFAAAYVSPLTRTKQTFNEINKSLNISDVTYMDELMERNFGELEGKPFILDYASTCWIVGKEPTYPVESVDHIVERIERAIERIKKEHPNENVLVVTHYGASRVFKYILEGRKDTDLSNYEFNNLQPIVYEDF